MNKQAIIEKLEAFLTESDSSQLKVVDSSADGMAGLFSFSVTSTPATVLKVLSEWETFDGLEGNYEPDIELGQNVCVTTDSEDVFRKILAGFFAAEEDFWKSTLDDEEGGLLFQAYERDLSFAGGRVTDLDRLMMEGYADRESIYDHKVDLNWLNDRYFSFYGIHLEWLDDHLENLEALALSPRKVYKA